MAGTLIPARRAPRVCLYRGLGRLMERSGVGSAMRHQASMLRAAGTALVGLWERPDVVQLNTVLPDTPLVALLARARGIPVVLYAHSTRQDFEQSWRGSKWLAPWFEQWLRLVYRCGDVVVTPTPYSKRIIDGYGLRAPVRVLTNGVDTDFFHGDPDARARFRRRHGLADGDRAVLSVGHLMVRKGIVEYVSLARSMPEVTFFWAGSAPEAMMTPDVRAALDDAPPNLRLLSQIRADEVRDAYAGADLFCFMSHEETQGIVVLEALASGVPVLVRDIPVYDGWLPRDAVHRARSVVEFRAAVSAILDGEAPARTARGRALAAGHDLRVVAGALCGIHAALVLREPQPSTTSRASTNAWMARSRSSRVSVALSCVRMRALPFGTTG